MVRSKSAISQRSITTDQSSSESLIMLKATMAIKLPRHFRFDYRRSFQWCLYDNLRFTCVWVYRSIPPRKQWEKLQCHDAASWDSNESVTEKTVIFSAILPALAFFLLPSAWAHGPPHPRTNQNIAHGPKSYLFPVLCADDSSGVGGHGNPSILENRNDQSMQDGRKTGVFFCHVLVKNDFFCQGVSIRINVHTLVYT